MTDFPPLCGEASTGKTKVWFIRVFGRDGHGVIQTVHGYQGGKMQTNEKRITVGKNVGKRNETTPFEQAELEARATWQKKVDSGYYPSGYAESFYDALEDEPSAMAATASATMPKATAAGSAAAMPKAASKAVDVEVPSPMLAHDYNKRGKDIVYPCYIQRKFDGTRCIGIPQKGLFSRNRKSYPHLDHIVEELRLFPPGFVLDGELYSTTLTFQEIVGMVKRVTLKEGDAEKQRQIKYFVYDIVSDSPYSVRFLQLQTLFQQHHFQHLVLVDTEMCASEEAMKESHARYVAEGYEGIMLRNATGVYRGVRSKELQKYKEFQDDEYEVVDFRQGEGQEEGCVLWVCRTPSGIPFSVRPRGTREDRAVLYQKGADYVGQRLTVRFQELTDDGVPRFPVGIAFRDYE
jgi:DNA ligase-1